MIYAETEGNIIGTLQRKQDAHREMQYAMTTAQHENGLDGIIPSAFAQRFEVHSDVATGQDWTLYQGDCVSVAKTLPADSIDFAIFSPPFSTLYVYTDLPEDMGNNQDHAQFFEHFDYLIPELWRITKPGRLCAVHCKDLPLYMNRDGASGLYDFPGDLVRTFTEPRFGSAHDRWVFHSRITIWKDPVIEMQRTKNHGLLWRNFTERGEVTRQGMADYVLVFRKWIDAAEMPDKQVRNDPDHYVGDDGPTSWRSQRDHSIQVWQKYASPVWFDIRQTNVLNVRSARSEDDEKHICPLQLDVIDRCVELWTNPGDTVFSPFAGIGSEGYVALRAGRKFTGIELKPEYWQQACRNLATMSDKANEVTLFDLAVTQEASA